MAIRLLIADDHEVVRVGLRAIFDRADHVEVVAEAVDGEDAYAQAMQTRPEVLLLDVRMPRTDGIACLAKLRVDLPGCAALMISGFENPTYVARAAAMGAVGYLSKNTSAVDLVAAVTAAAAGEKLWSRDDLRRVGGAMSAPRMAKDLGVPLTKREGEVLEQLALGLSNKEIALALEISYETVKEHVQHILRKVGVADRTQAAVWAVRQGIS